MEDTSALSELRRQQRIDQVVTKQIKNQADLEISLLTGYSWPESLVKSISDPFDYELRLSTGERIRFESCAPNSNREWVSIYGIKEMNGKPLESSQRFQRGIDLRVKEIVWCVDAPHGS